MAEGNQLDLLDIWIYLNGCGCQCNQTGSKIHVTIELIKCWTLTFYLTLVWTQVWKQESVDKFGSAKSLVSWEVYPGKPLRTRLCANDLWIPRWGQLSKWSDFLLWTPPKTIKSKQIKAGENIKLQKTSQNPLPFPAPPFNHPQLTASSSRKEALSAEKRPGILRGDHGPPGLRAEAVEEAVARQRSACSSTVCRLKVGGFEVCWENRHTTVN